MALTQISTAGVKDDAVTAGKIPADAVGSSEIAANAVGSSELADNAVDTAAIADQAVDLTKLPHGTGSNDGKFLRANNGADPTFETVNTDLVSDTSPQLGGDLASNGNNINMADNDIINVGSSNDLRIRHNGTNSLIEDMGTGNLQIRGDDVHITGTNDELMAKFVENGTVELYHNNVKKFETHDVGTIFTEAGSGTTQAAIKVNTTLDSHGSITVRDKRNVANSVSAFQVENASNGSNETNLLLRSVNLASSEFAHGIYSAKSHRFAVSSNTTPTVQIDVDGLKFNNDQASANALDDYEEGTFTPNFLVGTSSAHSYSHRNGKYTKIGDIVHFKLRVAASSLASASNPTEIKIDGFPFTIANDMGGVSFEAGGIVYVFAGLASNGYGALQYTIEDVNGGSDAGNIKLWKIGDGSTAASYSVGNLNRGDVTNNLDIRITGTCHVS